MAKFTDSDDEDDQIPLSSKFKNLKSDTPVLYGGDQGQAQSFAINSNRLVVKKRRLVKIAQTQ